MLERVESFCTRISLARILDEVLDMYNTMLCTFRAARKYLVASRSVIFAVPTKGERLDNCDC